MAINKEYDDIQLDVKFTQASSRANIVSEENISVSFSKLANWFEALVPTGGSSGQFLGWNSDGTAKWVSNPNSDTKVKNTYGTANTYYPAGMTQSSTTTTTQVADTSFKFIGTTGTTSEIGKAQLVLGNNIASGTANNKQGSLVIYGSTTYAHTLIADSGIPTENRTLYLPDKTDTLAVVGDIPTLYAGSNSTGGSALTVYGTLTNPSGQASYAIPFHTDISSGDKSLLNNDGIVYTCKQGTASATGFSIIELGNGINEGTAGNKYGLIRLYSRQGGDKYVQLYPATKLTANRNIMFPNAAGTVALTTDIPTVNDASLTLKGDGTDVVVFTANSANNKSLDITAGSNVTITPTVDSGTGVGSIEIASSHPTITKSADTTSTASPAHGGTFTVVDSVTREANGHVTKINTKTVTLPADSNTDTKVTQSSSTTSDFRPLLLGKNNQTNPENLETTVTDQTYVTKHVFVQPSTGNLTLYNASGDSPSLIFRRGTMIDNTLEWRIQNVGGKLNFDRDKNESTETWENIFQLDPTNNKMYFKNTEVSLSGHTHPLSIAADSGTNQLTLSANTKYKLTAGDNTFVFTTPLDTTYSAGNHLSLSSTTFSIASYCKSITDWNSATTNGWYMGSSVTNAPSTAWWFGRVVAHNNKYCMQEVWQFTASTDGHKVPHKMRMFVNNVWGNWTDITVGTQVPENAVFTDTKVTQTLSSDANLYPMLMSTDTNSSTASAITSTSLRNNSIAANPSNGLISCTGRYIKYFAIQTGSSKQQKISFQTLFTWLKDTKKYIPDNKYCHIVLAITWSYADNDILQLQVGTSNYELQLAGTIIEFMGYATSYNEGMFRLLIHSSPTTSFTPTSGYTAFPVSTIAEYTCNGSAYAPTWKKIWNSHPTYTERSKDIYKFHVNTLGHVDDATALDKTDVSTLINKLDTGSSTPVDADYYISQYVGGGATTTSYHRRPMSALWSYVKSKADSVYLPIGHTYSLSIAADSGTNQLTLSASTKYKLTAGGSTFVFTTPPDTKNTAGSTDTSSKIFLIGATSQAANPQTYSDDQCYVTSGTLQANKVQASVTVSANTANSNSAGGVSLYGTDPESYGVMFRGTSNSGKHGYVQSDWATYFTMNDNGTTRGWVFRRGTTNVASVSGVGHAVFNGSVTVGGNTTNTSGCRMEYNTSTQSLDFVFV